MDCQLDIFFLEAILNGLLLAGLRALLALGRNLIFGVIDVVWICYAELVMIGMYGINAVHPDHHQLGVADPHHVDDAEDQVAAEREQRTQAREQQPVEDRLEEKDVELTVHQPASSVIPEAAKRLSGTHCA